MKNIIQLVIAIALFAALSLLAKAGYVKEAGISLIILVGVIGILKELLIVPRFLIFVLFYLGMNDHYGWNLTAANDTERILDGIALVLFALSFKVKS